jgi:hypothetical protein
VAHSRTEWRLKHTGQVAHLPQDYSIGGAAYGIPLKTVILGSHPKHPCNSPDSIVTLLFSIITPFCKKGLPDSPASPFLLFKIYKLIHFYYLPKNSSYCFCISSIISSIPFSFNSSLNFSIAESTST